MKPIRIALALVVAVAVLVATACGGSDEQSVPSNAVAVVDGVPVAKAELTALMTRAKRASAIQKQAFPKAGTAEYQALQQQAAAFLVQRAEFNSRAEEMNVAVTDKEIDARIASLKKQDFGGSQAKMDKQLKAQGMTAADLRGDVRAQLLGDKLYKQITKQAAVTDAEVAKYYKDNKSQYVVADSRNVRHILVKTKAEADLVRKKIKAGGNWRVLAKKYSIDPGSKNNGGQMTILRGQTVAPFDTTAFLLTTNQVSQPIKTQYGYHVIQPISAVKPGKTTPLKAVKATIKAQLLEKETTASITEWTSETTKKFDGKVAYATGFAPPATTTDAATTTG